MSRMGMDVTQIEGIGKNLTNQSQQIENVMGQVEGLINQAMGAWEGADAQRFQQEWNSTHKPHLRNAATALQAMGQTAARQASEQRQVSGN